MLLLVLIGLFLPPSAAYYTYHYYSYYAYNNPNAAASKRLTMIGLIIFAIVCAAVCLAVLLTLLIRRIRSSMRDRPL